MDDRRVISGIIHLLRVGCRWEDCPASYGPSMTIYNRFNRWSHRGLWGRIFATLAAQAELPGDLSIDSTAVRAHRHGARPVASADWRWMSSLHKRIRHVGALAAAKMEIRASRCS